MYRVSSRGRTIHTGIYGVHIRRVGQNPIYMVYIRCFWQGNHQIYGHIRCIYTVLASPTYTVLAKNKDENPDSASLCSLANPHTHIQMTYTFPLLLITWYSSFQHLTRTYEWRTLFPYSWSPAALHFSTSHAHTTHIQMTYTVPLLLITCCSSF